VQEAGEKPINFSHNLKLHPWVMPDTSAEPTKDPALLWAGPPQPKIIANADGSTSTIPAPTIDPEPVHSWQYDEITFTDPPKAFLDILMSHPPTPLPKHTSSKKRPLPPNVAHVQSLGWATNRGGAVPEFTERLERDEAERLDAAKRAVIDATEVLRASLIEKEKELESLRRQVNHE
jgi:YEATS domain-containing protein 4